MDIVPTVHAVALLLAPGERQFPWQNEGPTRHALRRYLLHLRWTRSWHRADLKAQTLVALARAERRVALPRGWDSDSDLSAWIPTVECIICGRFVVHRYEGQQHCSTACVRRGAEIERWNILRIGGACEPPRCLWCRAYMEVDNPTQRFCNRFCKCQYKTLGNEERADQALAAKLRNARYARGLTQVQLARRAGVTHSYIKAIEDGRAPGGEDLRQQLLNILEIDADTEVPAPERRCGFCNVDISHMDPNAQYCCTWHRKRAAHRAAVGPRYCLECGVQLDPQSHGACQYCCEDHLRLNRNRRITERRRRLSNGHDHHDEADGPDPEDQPDVAGDAPGAGAGRAASAAGADRDAGADGAPAAGGGQAAIR